MEEWDALQKELKSQMGAVRKLESHGQTDAEWRTTITNVITIAVISTNKLVCLK